MGDQGLVCSLCGDVGFADALVRCLKCGYRLQHTYCSRYYPEKVDMERWGCEWCIHQDEEERRNKRQRREHHEPSSGPNASSQEALVGPKKISSKAAAAAAAAADRWRKLAKAAKMGSGRRYKLLADVLCS